MSSTITTDSVDLTELDTSPSLNVLTDNGKTEIISSSSQADNVVPTQLAQWVYIQTPPKMSTTGSSLNKNIVVNTMSPIQLSNLGSNITSKTMSIPSNQNVILAQHGVKPQHLYIQKQASSAGSKNTLAYLTMIKPQNQKYVIAPMPKLTSNRLAATVTTNSVQPKIALMPLTLQNTIPKPTISKHKVFNLKIADGKLQSPNNNRAITVMCEGKTDLGQTDLKTYFKSQETHNDQQKFICNDLLDNSKKELINDKSYELSIVEDNSSKNDVSFTFTIPDENDKTKPQPFRDVHKFSKHGVSILKKNLNFDHKPDKKFSISNSITTISDCNTKEVKISTINSFAVEDPVIVTERKTTFQKTERRRKSNFSYRKDYDEVMITQNVDEVSKLENTKIDDMDEVEVKLIKDAPDIADVKKILKWDDGIGTLPGSDIRFQINEFGMLEYLKSEEYKEILETRAKKIVKKADVQEEMCCLACGCFGMLNEFLNPQYCSMDCEEIGAKALKQKEARLKKKKLLKKYREMNSKDARLEIKEEFISEGDSTSNEYVQDKFSYPWNCTKKGFSWSKYLEHVKAKAVPVKFFKDPFPYNRNGFRPGMKLEGVDPQHPSYFCVLSVSEVIGYRLRLHFDGFSENYDFWVNADSMDIFPAGWCEKYNHTLHPPPGYTEKDFNWATYLKQTKGTVAPKHLFANRAGSAICPNGFRVGMKLEAVDKKNTSLVCVATVVDMMDNRILVHFDSWDDIYDYWADPTSPYIHPVGWSDQNGHSLTPPNNYPQPETFTWEKYLKETKSTAAPVRAFKQRPVYGFKRGMRLECVDKRVPQLIRVATVDDTKEHQIRISFDGWPDRYSYWVDNYSTHIHPIGWCQKTGHPIEPPLTPDDVYDFLECPTVGCRGQGHINGSKFSTHSLTTDCPYSDENMYREHVLPDRLLSPDRQLESVVPISREPKEKIKSKTGRPPKVIQAEPQVKSEWNCSEMDVDEPKPLKRKYSKCFKNELTDKNVKKAVPLTNGYDNTYTEQIWEKHSNYLHKYLKNNLDPREWQEEDVIEFIGSIPYSHDYGALFKEHKIDGEALLMLSQKDIVDILSIKLGPAIKLYNIIMLLRRSVVS